MYTPTNKKHPSWLKVSSLACVVFLGLTVSRESRAAINISIPNADFQTVANEGSQGGSALSASYSGTLGSGPWSSSGSGLLNLLVTPETTIGSGVATFSSLTYYSIGGISNSARFFQNDIGTTFIQDYTYTLTAQVTTEELIGTSLLTDIGLGVGLLSNGSATPSANGSTVLIDLNLLSDYTASVSYTFTAGAGLDGTDIGVELYAGRGSGLSDITTFGTISFDNVTLNAVPELNTSAATLGIVLLLSTCFIRRLRSQN